MKLKLLAILGMLLLSACVTPPTEEEIAAADYGHFMSQGECVSLVEQRIKAKLKDPYSAVFEHGISQKGYGASPGTGTIFGYILQGTVNAKNSFGAYTGATKYQAVLRNGRVELSCVAESDYGICILSK